MDNRTEIPITNGFGFGQRLILYQFNFDCAVGRFSTRVVAVIVNVQTREFHAKSKKKREGCHSCNNYSQQVSNLCSPERGLECEKIQMISLNVQAKLHRTVVPSNHRTIHVLLSIPNNIRSHKLKQCYLLQYVLYLVYITIFHQLDILTFSYRSSKLPLLVKL